MLNRRWVFATCAIGALLAALGPAAQGQKGKIDVLRIGASSTFNSSKSGIAEEAAFDTLKAFIKEETGFDNKIEREKDWTEVADKLAKGQLHIGAFEGVEYAWALEKYPALKPLALAVNVYRYPIAYVIVNKQNKAKDFKGLQGQTVALYAASPPHLRMFVDREAEKSGKKTDAFFSKVVTVDGVEDALDDVVDGVVQATVADRAALEAFKRRKPGRFEKLKEVLKSEPFPPPVVAYFDNMLDNQTTTKFREGLLGASKKEKGQMVLTLFRITGFELAPEDFGKVLADTRKNYPPLNGKK